MYDFGDNKLAKVEEFCIDGDWNISLNRALTEADLKAWVQLMCDLQSGQPAKEAGSDVVSWGLENSGSFTTKSLYRFITYGGLTSTVDQRIWKCTIPTKIKVFMWQLHHGKLSAATVLKKKV